MEQEYSLTPVAFIVDADEQRCIQVRAVLETAGYRVLAASRLAFRDLCQQSQPDLVIVSHILPYANAFELCQWMQNNLAPQPATLIVLETIDSSIIAQVLQAGADDFITSPIDSKLLERRIRGLSNVIQTGKTQEMADALGKSERRYKALFDNAPVSIFSKDFEGRYTSANAYNLTFHRPGGPVGFTDAELFPAETAQALRASDLQVMETGEELEIEEAIPTAVGVRFALSRKVPLRNADGNIEGVLGISEDITERKRVEQALQETNQRFQALFEHSPDAIFLIEPDPPSLIVDCNEVACRMNGYTREELIGHSINMLDGDNEGIIPPRGLTYRRWLEEEGTVHYQALHRRSDGTVFPIEVSTCFVNVSGHELILGIDRDISERYAIEASERELRVLAEALRDTAYALNSTLDLDEVLDRILMQAARVVPHETSSIGLIENDIVRIVRCRGFAERGLEELALSMRFPIAGHTHYTAMIANREPIVVEDVRDYPGWFTNPDVDWIRAHVATPIIVRDEVIGFLHLDSSRPGAFNTDHAHSLQVFGSQVAIAIQNAQDTDELERQVRERTAELRCALIRERELSELKTRFITMASHEFRTPMSIMMTSSELLKKYHDRMTVEQRNDRLLHIQAEIKNMTALLEDILKVNKTVDTNPKQVKLEVVDVGDFCRNLLAKVSSRERRSIDLIISEDCGVAAFDPNLLTDILTSLLSNAVKYSRTGEPIQLSVICNPDELVFNVQDHGIGIPEEDQERVFEVFHRGRNVSHISGTGLGLAIAKQSAELHGGKLTFSSRLGAGTTFTLIIPKAFAKEWA